MILKALAASPQNQGLRNLSELTAQFIHYLHKEEGTSYAKADLARDDIYTLIAKREMNLRRPGQTRKRATNEWLSANGVDAAKVVAWLKNNGGFCDCEVVANARDHWEANR